MFWQSTGAILENSFETGFYPTIYYIATNHTIQQVCRDRNKADPKEQNKRKKRETNATPADRLNKNDPQPLRPPEKSHHAPSTLKRRLPSNTFKKKSYNDDDVARTSPRVSPSTRRGWGRGTLEALQEETATPVGVTTSVPVKPTRISPDPQKTTTPNDRECSTQLAAHLLAPP
jgi:hypothetical protein